MRGICLALLLVSSASGQGIYKWVDKEGRTHYSSKKEDAAEANAAEVRIKALPPSDPNYMAPKFSPDLGSPGNQPPGAGPGQARPPVERPPVSLSGGRAGNTDASRCNLARDVLSGAVRLRNGNPTDETARRTAENDVRLFCRD